MKIGELARRMHIDPTVTTTTSVERDGDRIYAVTLWRDGEKPPHGQTIAAMARSHAKRGERVKQADVTKIGSLEGISIRLTEYAVSAR